jgi:hypothetical protein
VSVPSSELGPPTPSPLASVSPIWDPKGVSNTLLRVTGYKGWHSVYAMGEGKKEGEAGNRGNGRREVRAEWGRDNKGREEKGEREG